MTPIGQMQQAANCAAKSFRPAAEATSSTDRPNPGSVCIAGHRARSSACPRRLADLQQGERPLPLAMSPPPHRHRLRVSSSPPGTSTDIHAQDAGAPVAHGALPVPPRPGVTTSPSKRSYATAGWHVTPRMQMPRGASERRSRPVHRSRTDAEPARNDPRAMRRDRRYSR